MLSFNNLGNLGRLGNQMFQYAALKGISKRHNYKYMIPLPQTFGNFDKKVSNSDGTIYDYFNLKYDYQGLSKNSVRREESFEKYDDNLFENCPNNIDLYGYFQSEKYFRYVQDEIKEDFTFLDYIKEPTFEMFNQVFGNSEVISIHIRRGDYVSNANHPIQSLHYYKKSIEMFDKDLPIMIFSDDILWCKDQTIFSGDRFVFSENNDTGTDLMLQTLCKYHIIANSSFSWWGAWLSKSKKVIAPKKWLGRNVHLKDLYCKTWELI